MPLFVRPFLYFLYRYVVAGGFLDGRAGLIYHIFQGLWLRLLVDWKTIELRWLDMDDATLEQMASAMLTIQTGSVAEARRAVRDPHPTPGR